MVLLVGIRRDGIYQGGVWQGEQLCEVDYGEDLAGGDVGGCGKVEERQGGEEVGCRSGSVEESSGSREVWQGEGVAG